MLIMAQKDRAEKKKDKNELIDIINKLIDNIKLKDHEPEVNAEKIIVLQQIKELIGAEKTTLSPGDKRYDSYLDKINNACQIKRSVVHYWSTPHHVRG